MEIKAYKCEYCGDVFESEIKYQEHIKQEQAIEEFEKKYPIVKAENKADFYNGKYSIQRSKSWYEEYKRDLLKIIPRIEYPPFSYAWYRYLDDGDSPFYQLACRALCICEVCYKEWGQQYYKENCLHGGK